MFPAGEHKHMWLARPNVSSVLVYKTEKSMVYGQIHAYM